MRVLLLLLLWLAPVAAGAQTLQDLLQEDPDAIADPSRRTVGATLDRLAGAEGLPGFLEAWQGKALVRRASDGLFFVGLPDDGGHRLLDVATGAEAGRAGPHEVEEIKPNAGVRGVIGRPSSRSSSPTRPVRRQSALDAIAADPAPGIWSRSALPWTVRTTRACGRARSGSIALLRRSSPRGATSASRPSRRWARTSRPRPAPP
jgi:urea transport system permease protein